MRRLTQEEVRRLSEEIDKVRVIDEELRKLFHLAPYVRNQLGEVAKKALGLNLSAMGSNTDVGDVIVPAIIDALKGWREDILNDWDHLAEFPEVPEDES